MKTLECKFSPGQLVQLADGDSSLKVSVTQVCWESETSVKYEVSWIHNGDVKSVWVASWRVKSIA